MSSVPAIADIVSQFLAEDLASEEWWQDTVTRLRGAFGDTFLPTRPAELFGRPCPLPAHAWHLQRLDEIRRQISSGSTTTAHHARRLYHQRMLAHLIEPQRAKPLVTILIPVYNRPHLLVEAVRSCLEQTWRPIEILVIDDGSDDDPAAALRGLGGEIRLHRKRNGGAASARNAGIQLARGDFIHFLDSDDLLLPNAVARKVESFAVIPDATLCFSTAIERNLPHVRVPKVRVPDGSDLCATSDLLYASLGRCPFYVPTVMMPRWAMLSLPPFEKDLRRGEDTRYWFNLGLAGAKVIGLSEPLVIRRVVPDGLSTVPHLGNVAVDIKLRCLRDILRTPSAWHHGRFVLVNIAHKLEQSGDLADDSLDRITSYADLVATLSELGDGQPREGLSPVPLLVDLRNALKTAKPHLVPRWLSVWTDLNTAITSSLRSAAPMTSRDLSHWGQRTMRAHTRTSIARLFQSLLRAAEDEPTIARRIDPMLRRAFPTPGSRTVKRYRKLRRTLRSGRLAAWLTWPSAYLPALR
jgi:glycosyltransferase involved in cell wall biosynthesis